jgi:hypothetical protein
MGAAPCSIVQRQNTPNPDASKWGKSEAEYSISLGNLREAAEALGCELVYAIVPKNGSIEELVQQRARAKATENIRAVEHTMALEDQAVGRVDEKIEEHSKRMLQR